MSWAGQRPMACLLAHPRAYTALNPGTYTR
jgi:hypothetical protein